MKNKESKRVFKIMQKVMITFFVGILVFVLPLIGLRNENLENIYSVFVGNKSKYQGMIEIWNIDTFESGKSSKSSFLSYASNLFQKKNKGLYFMIRNVTEQELEYLLESGERPDLFSCSYGVAEKIKEYVQPFELKSNIKKEFLEAGKFDGKQVGYAWCFSPYVLMTTKAKLEEAKVSEIDDIKLSSIALSCGYEKVFKKSTKVIYSLGLGYSKYLLPEVAFGSYNKSEETAGDKFSINDTTLNQTQYLAYSRFVAGESVMLLGSLRDVFRMEGRLESGKVQDVIYEVVSGFTDLVQFLFVSDSGNGIREQVAQEFVKFMLGSSVQNELSKLGMLSTLKYAKIDSNNGVISHIIPQNIGVYVVNNIFIGEDEIAGLREKFKLI